MRGDVLLLTESLPQTITHSEYVSKWAKILDILSQKFNSKQIHIKTHPRFPSSASIFDSYFNVDKNIPSDLIISNYKVIIGIQSSTMLRKRSIEKI